MSAAVSSPVVASAFVVAVIGAGDPASSRLVYSMVVGLAVIGVAFLLLGVWVLRQTRADLEVLAPLERMGDGDWKKRDPSTQRRILDEVRPAGAQPLVSEPLAPPIDAEFEQGGQPVTSFSDLGPGIVAEQRDPTPPHFDLDLGLQLPDVDVTDDSDPDDEFTDDEITDVEITDDSDPDDEITDVEITDDGDIGARSDSDEALSDPHA